MKQHYTQIFLGLLLTIVLLFFNNEKAIGQTNIGACIGETIDLDDATGINGNWTYDGNDLDDAFDDSSDTFNTTDVSPGIYTFTITINGQEDEANVLVLPNPASSLLLNPESGPQGSTIDICSDENIEVIFNLPQQLTDAIENIENINISYSGTATLNYNESLVPINFDENSTPLTLNVTIDESTSFSITDLTISYNVANVGLAFDCTLDGMAATATANVVVPDGELTASSTEICAGETVTLTYNATNPTASPYEVCIDLDNDGTNDGCYILTDDESVNVTEGINNFSGNTTIDILRITDSNVCVNNAPSDTPVDISVTAIPSVVISPSANPVCANTIWTATANVINESDFLQELNYEWDYPVGDSPTFNANQISYNNISTAEAGIYSVTVTTDDNAACEGSASIDLAVGNTPSVTIAATNDGNSDENIAWLCGNSQLTANHAPSGNGQNYAWSYDNNSIGGDNNPIDITNSGTYRVTVTYNYGSGNICEVIDEIEVLISDINLTAQQNATDNCGQSSGSAMVTPTGGQGIYEYLWNDANAQETPTAINLAAGTYTVTVTDDLDCTESASVEITAQGGPSITNMNPTAVSECGGSNGQIIVSVSGSVDTYTWSHDPNLNSNTASDLSAGTYSVTVTDGNGCSDTESTTVTAQSLTVNITPTNTTCGANNGSATANVSGGSESYDYVWSTIPAQTTASAINLAGGVYTVTITDTEINCEVEEQVTIGASSSFDFTLTESYGCGVASIVADDITDGWSITNYEWSNGTSGATTNSISEGLLSIEYTVIITANDNANTVCTQEQSITLNIPQVATYTLNGEITTDITMQAYTTPLANCSAPNGISNEIDFSDIIILTGDNAGQYGYEWTNIPVGFDFTNSFIADFEGLDIGIYEFEYIISSNGDNPCNDITGTVMVEVIECECIIPVAPIVQFNNANIEEGEIVNICNNGSSFAFTLENGNVGTWTNGIESSTGASFSPIEEGDYSVTYTDSFGCESDATNFSVAFFNQPSITDLTIPNDICEDTETININASVSLNGTNGWTSSWTSSEDAGMFDNATSASTTYTPVANSGSFTLTYTAIPPNGNPCSTPIISDSQVVNVENLPSVTNPANNAGDGVCVGEIVNLSATLNPANSTGSWSIVNGNGTLNNETSVTGATYETVESDVNVSLQWTTNIESDSNCFGSVVESEITSFIVNALPSIEITAKTRDEGEILFTDYEDIDIINDEITICGGDDVRFDAGAANISNYSWSDNITSNTTTQSAYAVIGLTQTTTYTVEFTDNNGCINTASVTVNVEDKPSLSNIGKSCNIIDGTYTTTGNYSPSDATINTEQDVTNASFENGVFSFTANTSVTTVSLSITTTNCSNTIDIVAPDCDCSNITVPQSNVTSFTVCDINSLPTLSVNNSTTGLTTSWYASSTGLTVLDTGTSFTPSAGNFTAPSTSYFAEFQDADGCPSDSRLEFMITVNAPTVNITAGENQVCNNQSTTLTAVGNGGTGNLSYQWSGNLGTNNTAIAGSGTYTVTVTDNNNCTASANITINSLGIVGINETISSTTCGAANGTISIQDETGNTYLWTNGINSTTNVAENLAAGTYGVTVTDINGCTGDETFNIGASQGLTFTTTASDSNCGQSNGSATVQNIQNATGNVTYSWSHSTGLNSATANNLASGTYSVTVMDNAGCSNVETVNVNDTGAPTINNATAVNATCGENNGQIIILASGSGNLQYSWSHDENLTTTTASNLPAGTYTVEVSDSNGCIVSETTELSNTPPPTINITQTTNPDCGVDNGQIIASASGETPNLTYAWSHNNNLNSSTASNLPGGSYTITVTDGNNCTNTATATINAADAPQISLQDIDVSNANCGEDNGTATTDLTGVDYAWQNAQGTTIGTNASIDNLAAGQYTLQITEAGTSCSSSQGFTIDNNNGFTFTPTIAADCGQATMAIPNLTNGFTADTYQWSDNLGSLNTAIVSETGSYSVTVTGTNNLGVECEHIDENIVVAANDIYSSPTATVTITENVPDNTICNDSTITLLATGSGGLAPYSYIWNNGENGSNGQNTVTPPNNATTPYTVTITDSRGCEDVESINIIAQNCECPPISVPTNNTSSTIVCDINDFNKTLTVTSSDDVRWFNQNEDFTITPLATGLNFTATENNGTTYYAVAFQNDCFSQPRTFSITQTQLNITEISPTSATCNNTSDGSVTINATAAATYTVAETTQGNNTFNGLEAGSYSVVVTDSNGCANESTFTIDNIDTAPTINSSTLTPDCVGGEGDGIATINAIGDNLSYAITGNAAQAENIFTSLTAGSYNITVTNQNDCSTASSFAIEEADLPNEPIINNGQDISVCEGENVSLSVTNVQSNVDYVWQSGTTSEDGTSFNVNTTDFPAQTYTVTITATNTNNCVETTLKDVIVKQTPEITNISPVCAGDCIDANCNYILNVTTSLDGTIRIGGTDYTPNNAGEIALNNVTQGNYNAVLTADNGCESQTVSFNLNSCAPDNPCADYANLPNPITPQPVEICVGDDIPSFDVTFNDEPANYQIKWYYPTENDSVATTTGNASYVPEIENSIAGNYTYYAQTFVLGSDGETECESAASLTSFILEIDALPTAQISGDETICSGEPINLTAFPNNQIYLWETGDTTTTTTQILSIDTLSQTTEYSVTVFNPENGTCNTIATQTVIVSNVSVTLLDNDQTICEGDEITITATAAGNNLSYLWSTGDTTKIISGVSNLTTYSITVTDGNGCEATDVLEITIVSKPNATLETNQANAYYTFISSCPPVNVDPNTPNDIILNSYFNNNTDINGTWTDITSGTPTPINGDVSFDFLSDAQPQDYVYVYTVSPVDSSPCNDIATDTLVITTSSCLCPPLFLNTNSQSFCAGSALDIDLSETYLTDFTLDNGTWEITPASNFNINGNILTTTDGNTGTYTLTYSLNPSDVVVDCPSTINAELRIEENQLTLEIEGPTEICSSVTNFINLTANTNAEDPTYLWSTEQASNTIQVPPEDSLYTLTVIDGTNDCSVTTEHSITTIAAPDVVITNAVITVDNLESCGNSELNLSDFLSGDNFGGGQWKIVTTNDEDKLPLNSIAGENVNFDGVAEGAYVFEYTVDAEAPCNIDGSDNLSVQVIDCIGNLCNAPSYAPKTFNVCGSETITIPRDSIIIDTNFFERLDDNNELSLQWSLGDSDTYADELSLNTDTLLNGSCNGVINLTYGIYLNCGFTNSEVFIRTININIYPELNANNATVTGCEEAGELLSQCGDALQVKYGQAESDINSSTQPFGLLDSTQVFYRVFWQENIDFYNLDSENVCEYIGSYSFGFCCPFAQIGIKPGTEPNNANGIPTILVCTIEAGTESGTAMSYEWGYEKDGVPVFASDDATFASNHTTDNQFFVIDEALQAANGYESYVVRVVLNGSCETTIGSYKAPYFSNPSDEQASISLYPNPNNGSFTLAMQHSENGKLDINIYDVVGKQIYSIKAQKETTDFARNIQLPDIRQGVYFVEIGLNEQEKYIKKVVIF
ncbi:MAG: T9SS type A sorting domain-containing protein [Chitinophagales bacterium]